MNNSESYDYLIIGQGLAGTLLHHELAKSGKKVMVIDKGLEGNATTTAAGIINPVTGRRFVKSWKFDQLLPQAIQTYKELETLLKDQFFYSAGIIRSLFNRKDAENWFIRTGEPGYEKYLQEKADLDTYSGNIEEVFAFGETIGGGRASIGKLVRAYRAYLLSQDRLIQEPFDYDQLEWDNSISRYQGVAYKRVIFCEGHAAASNPWFGFLPFGGTKGEVLIVKIVGVKFQKLLKQRIFIVPMEKDLYWIGSRYHWDFPNEQPTEAGGAYLKERLEEVLKVPFEIVSHLAAVRPTVKDRRPFLGQHPDWKPLFIFNGLGTKGASLGPYFARQMKNFLEQDHDLDPEVNIRRFIST